MGNRERIPSHLRAHFEECELLFPIVCLVPKGDMTLIHVHRQIFPIDLSAYKWDGLKGVLLIDPTRVDDENRMLTIEFIARRLRHKRPGLVVALHVLPHHTVQRCTDEGKTHLVVSLDPIPLAVVQRMEESGFLL